MKKLTTRKYQQLSNMKQTDALKQLGPFLFFSQVIGLKGKQKSTKVLFIDPISDSLNYITLTS